MPPVDSHAPGSFCWFELGTSDQPAAKSFYGELFGWAAEDKGMGPAGVYTVFQLEGRDVAAAYTLPENMKAQGVPPHWLPYIAVQSAVQAAEDVARQGGVVKAGPFDVQTLGRMAVAEDPTGASFAIWEPRDKPGTGIAGEKGTVVWADLLSPEPSEATAFYANVFGWQYEKGEHDPSGYLHIRNGETFLGGVPPAEENGPPRAHWLLYFQVENVNSTVEKAQGLGAKVYVPGMNVPGAGRFAILADPQGAVFAIWKNAR